MNLEFGVLGHMSLKFSVKVRARYNVYKIFKAMGLEEITEDERVQLETWGGLS